VLGIGKKMVYRGGCIPTLVRLQPFCRVPTVLVRRKRHAEPRVSVTVEMGGAILLPQQQQGYALAFEFARNPLPVGLPLITRRAPRAVKQQLRQSGVVILPRW
jgi:hypothetical protein